MGGSHLAMDQALHNFTLCLRPRLILDQDQMVQLVASATQALFVDAQGGRSVRITTKEAP